MWYICAKITLSACRPRPAGYVNRPSATELLKPETTFSELNFSLDSKRILNPKNKVSKSDNVKQHRLYPRGHFLKWDNRTLAGGANTVNQQLTVQQMIT